MCEVMVFFAELDDIVFECGMTDETVGGVDVEGAAVGVGARSGVGLVAEEGCIGDDGIFDLV